MALRLKDKAKYAYNYLEKDDMIKAFDSKSFGNKGLFYRCFQLVLLYDK